MGGVAGSEIGRLALKGDSFGTGYGYGVFFTNGRIVGLSYTRMLSRSYYPAYLVCLAFFVSLTLAIVFVNMAGIPADQPLPLVFGPILALLPLTFVLLYLRPSQAAKRITRDAPVSLLDLMSRSPDIVIERGEVS